MTQDECIQQIKEGSLDHFLEVLCQLTGRTDKEMLADECFETNGKRGMRIEMHYLPQLWREALKIADKQKEHIVELERLLRDVTQLRECPICKVSAVQRSPIGELQLCWNCDFFLREPQYPATPKEIHK